MKNIDPKIYRHAGRMPQPEGSKARKAETYRGAKRNKLRAEGKLGGTWAQARRAGGLIVLYGEAKNANRDLHLVARGIERRLATRVGNPEQAAGA